MVLPGLPAVLFVKDVRTLKISVYPVVWHCVCFSSAHIRVGIARLGLLISPELSNPLFLSLGPIELPCSLDEHAASQTKSPAQWWARKRRLGKRDPEGAEKEGSEGEGKGKEGRGEGVHWVHEMVPRWLA